MSSAASNIATSILTDTTYSHSQTFVPVVPDVFDPYLIESKNTNGTVVIAVGTIIISVFMIIFMAKFWFWLKNRKAAKEGTKFDDYFGNGGSYNEIHDTHSNLSLLNYDSRYFDEKKSLYGISAPNSPYQIALSTDSSSSSSASSSSSPSIILANDKIARQGHTLRSALTQQTNIPQYSANINRNRNSFISPINELISGGEMGVEVSQGSPQISSNTKNEIKKRKTKSISKFENFDINNEVKDLNGNNQLHSRTTSMELNDLEKMINDSFINDTTTTTTTTTTSNKSSPNQGSEGSNRKTNRPPSVILDMLVQNDMDLS